MPATADSACLAALFNSELNQPLSSSKLALAALLDSDLNQLPPQLPLPPPPPSNMSSQDRTLLDLLNSDLNTHRQPLLSQTISSQDRLLYLLSSELNNLPCQPLPPPSIPSEDRRELLDWLLSSDLNHPFHNPSSPPCILPPLSKDDEGQQLSRGESCMVGILEPSKSFTGTHIPLGFLESYTYTNHTRSWTETLEVVSRLYKIVGKY